MMHKHDSHIVSRCSWHTSFDQKENASGLQDRISAWSRMHLHREVSQVFDNVCAPGQTWRIQSLTLDLGTIAIDDLEKELSMKLRRQLREQLTDLMLYASRNSSNIEVLNEETSQITILSGYLMHGIMPWNYNPVTGTASQLMAFQLQNNQQKVIAMIRKLGVTHANVRKRIAWQLNDSVVSKIVEGLEPNNHAPILNFSNELTKIQQKEAVIQTGMSDFRKHLWLWVLNFLLTERGTLFNKIAFMKSSIRQMADHYNIHYNELLELIEQAVYKISGHSYINGDFVTTLLALSKENEQSKKKTTRQPGNNSTDSWEMLERLFRNNSLRKTASEKALFNELITALSRKERARFNTFVNSFNVNQWKSQLTELDEIAIATIFKALSPATATEIIVNIHFLNKVIGSTIQVQKTIWKIGLVFVHDHPNTIFDTTIFLTYCMAELGKKDKRLQQKLINNVFCNTVPTAAKTLSGLDMYASLTAVCITTIKKEHEDLPAQHLQALSAEIIRQLSLRNPNKQLLSSLHGSIHRYIQLYPSAALSFFTTFSDKQLLQRVVLNELLTQHTIELLIRHTPTEIRETLQKIRKVMRELKSDKTVGNLAARMDDSLFEIGLQLVIFQPKLNLQTFLEQLFEKLSIQVSDQSNNFHLLLNCLTQHKEFTRSAVSKAMMATIVSKFQYTGTIPVLETVRYKLNTNGNQQEVAQLLTQQFTDQAFVQLRQTRGSEQHAILNYLLPGGWKLLEKYIKEYAIILAAVQKISSSTTLLQELTTLAWKCILDYAHHRGNKNRLHTSFEKAVAFRFHIPVKPPTIGYKSTAEHTSRKATYAVKNDWKLSVEELVQLTKNCLKHHSDTTSQEGIIYRLSDLLLLLLENAPVELRRLLEKLPVSEKRITLLQATVDFQAFSFWIVSDQRNATMRELQLLYELILQLGSEQLAANLSKLFWKTAWNVLATKHWSQRQLQQLVSRSFQELVIDSPVTAESIAEILHKKNLRLTKNFQTLLIAHFPTVSNAFATEKSGKLLSVLKKCEDNQLLDELLYDLLEQQTIPSWFAALHAFPPKKLLAAIVTHYPLKLLSALKRSTVSATQLEWLDKHLDFSVLIHSIGSLYRSREAHLKLLAALYTTFSSISLPGISGKELQLVLFRKVIIAWTTGNWSMLAANQIWNELIWEATVQKGIPAKELLQRFQQSATVFPPPLQVALSLLVNKEIRRAQQPEVQLPQLQPSVMLKETSPTLLKTGITVHNAGIVLISSYISMLFERLQLTTEQAFVDEQQQLNAVHYLQYVATGLTQTEEPLLPLNKVMCGIPLDTPVPAGIVISREQQLLIDGMITAIIGHWPVIGTCSVDGFRGNWLVRNGLLTEHEDKWELSVEKKAYDLLIHQSPFSFSIIKQPWMQKPLHVNWSY